ncbi:MAG: transcription-repair coupling factor [Terriglobales bacterium]
MIVPFVRDFVLELGRRPALEAALAAMAAGRRPELDGLTPGAQALAAVLLARRLERPLILITADDAAAEAAWAAVETFRRLTEKKPEEPALVFPAFEIDPYQGLSPHEEILEQRARALWKATQGVPFLLAPAAAAATKLAAPAHYRHLARTLRTGGLVDLEGLAEQLIETGYRRTDPVEAPGQFSVRGGLLDVFGPEAEHPVRMELFGDEIESLREFHPETQRSLRPLAQTVLLPLTSLPLTAERRERMGLGRHDGPPPGWEFTIPAAENFHHSLFDLAPDAVVMVLEPDAVAASLAKWWEHLRQQHQHRCSVVGDDAGQAVPPPESLAFAPEAFAPMLAALSGAELSELRLGAAAGAGKLLLWRSHPVPAAAGIPRLVEECRRALEAGERRVLMASSWGTVERLADVFREYELPFQLGMRPEHGEDYLAEKSYYSTEAPTLVLLAGQLEHGFALPDEGLAFLGHGDLFRGEEGPWTPAPAPKRARAATFLSEFRDLTAGDYVVHVEHGIGRYLGLKTLGGETGGEPGTEFMILEYAEAAKLYVPLTRLDLVQKYRSAAALGEEATAQPALDRLGGTQWQLRKARVKKAMQDMADELLKLYAARQAVHVTPCAEDDHWQRVFDDAFPFAETEDQERAIGEVRKDLAQPRPMDRLLVGDVGYGKTEVAMRAAFRLVNENRQVAVLAPTTVLAFQHYQTFQQRFAAFPVTVEMLSRFRSPAQQKETLRRLAEGKVDIVVGTHRLLSKDVLFQDLGLVVVDEEQRFGVRHKERLKQMKREVHVLAMSATPIPRTLNMALGGIRDLSVIETPPKDRLAIQTVVAPWDEDLLKTALETELGRSGQVYFVHNRVDTIWEIAALLQTLAPEARIAVGHGQMDEQELEKVMLRFIRHEADVLVSTTIIENGLDIPLANTILVNRADRLGLSELYQLRGRVGRSNRRAYAYLLIPAQAEITPIARKRLAAMREFSDLGAGFKIAALDLELRGAGNLLGGEQSGHMEAVGFDLYVQMLEQTVRELKGEDLGGETEPQIQLGLEVRIPHDYIGEESQRLRMYKRLAAAEDPRQREDAERELRDRYGPPPAAVRNLLDYAALKAACRQVGIEALERKREGLQVKFARAASGAPPRFDPARLAELAAQTPGARLTPQGVLTLPVRGASGEFFLRAARDLLAQLETAPAATG